MNARGFTLVELLIAMLVSLLVAAAALALAGAARTALAVEPAVTDTVRRLREGADAIAGAVAGAGGERGIGEDRRTVGDSIPAVRLLIESGEFSGLSIVRVVQGGRGRLALDQPGPAGSLTLEPADGLCPDSGEVCGFSPGDVAAVFDDRGHFDVFIVGAVSTALGRVAPRAPLAHAYLTGAWVVAVRQERWLLARQADGAQTLTRITAAGAREPVVDGITRLELRAWGTPAPPELDDGVDVPGFARYGLPPPAAIEVDPEGIFADGAHCMVTRGTEGLASSLAVLSAEADGLAPLTAPDFEDGPWCPHDDAPERFDADWFRVRRIDLRLEVEAPAAEFRGPAGGLFARGGAAAHDARRWVRDRAIQLSVAVGR